MKIKKFISVFLALSIFLGLFSYADASTFNPTKGDTEVQNQMLRILASVEPEKENYGLQNVNFSSVEIGNDIPTYAVRNARLVDSDIRLIPLLHSGKLVSFFYVATLSNGEIFVQLSNELVEPITFYNTESIPFSLIYDDVGAYIYTDSSLYLLGTAETTLYTDEDTNRHYSQFSTETSCIEHISADNEANNIVFSLSDNELSAIDASSFSVNTVLNVEAFLNALSTPYTATSKYLPVEIIKQPANTNICWAIAVTSLANYVFHTTNTYEGILQLFNGGNDVGAYIEHVFYRFNDVFHTIWSYEYTTTIAPDLAMFYLERGYPLYGDFTRKGGAHAVVIRGTNTVTKTFSIMNPTPTTTGYTTGTISTSNVWSFISGYSGSVYTLRAYGFPGYP